MHGDMCGSPLIGRYAYPYTVANMSKLPNDVNTWFFNHLSVAGERGVTSLLSGVRLTLSARSVSRLGSGDNDKRPRRSNSLSVL